MKLLQRLLYFSVCLVVLTAAGCGPSSEPGGELPPGEVDPAVDDDVASDPDAS